MIIGSACLTHCGNSHLYHYYPLQQVKITDGILISPEIATDVPPLASQQRL